MSACKKGAATYPFLDDVNGASPKDTTDFFFDGGTQAHRDFSPSSTL
jgi:hypothetical protein